MKSGHWSYAAFPLIVTVLAFSTVGPLQLKANAEISSVRSTRASSKIKRLPPITTRDLNLSALPIEFRNGKWTYSLDWSSKLVGTENVKIVDVKTRRAVRTFTRNLPSSGRVIATLLPNREYKVTYTLSVSSRGSANKILTIRPAAQPDPGFITNVSNAPIELSAYKVRNKSKRRLSSEAQCASRSFDTNRSGIFNQAQGGNRITSSVNPGQDLFVKCNYGVISGYVTLEGGGVTNCSFVGWDNLSAVFHCAAVQYEGNFNLSCRMSANAADNSCASLNETATVSVRQTQSSAGPGSQCINRTFNPGQSGIFNRAKGGDKIGSTLTPAQEVFVKCNYGVMTGYITLEGGGVENCGFAGWDSYSAAFRCSAVPYAGNYSLTCRLLNSPSSDNSCASTEAAATFSVQQAAGGGETSAPSISAIFRGKGMDVVAPYSTSADGSPDASLQIILNGSEGRQVARVRVDNVTTGGIWDSKSGPDYWIVKVVSDLNGTLLNQGDQRTLNFSMNGGQSVTAFIPDVTANGFNPDGSTLRVTVEFADGTAAFTTAIIGTSPVATTTTTSTTATTTLPAPKATLSAAFVSKGMDIVSPYALAPDGSPDATVSVTLGGGARRQVNRVRVQNLSSGGIWDSRTGASERLVQGVRAANQSVLNAGDQRTLNFTVASGETINLTVPDTAGNGLNQNGSTLETQLFFDDGTDARATAAVVGTVEPMLMLTFLDKRTDKVGAYSTGADGVKDASMLLTLKQGGRQQIRNIEVVNGHGGVWTTVAESWYWVARVDNATTGRLLNRANRTVDFALNEGDGVIITVPDIESGALIAEGMGITVNVTLASGLVISARTDVSLFTGTAPTQVSTNVELDPSTIVNFNASNSTLNFPGESYGPGEQTIRFDTNGNAIDAHDGQISQFGGRYYLYGTSYDCGFRWLSHNTAPFCGFKTYSSADLVHWQDDGLMFDPKPWEQECANIGCFRPHVIFNQSTGKYVLWINAASPTNGFRVFESSSPNGGFSYVGDPQNLLDASWAGDMNLYRDTDGKAYVIFTNYGPVHTFEMYVQQLDATYRNAAAGVAPVRVNYAGEAPTMFKRGSKYYLVMNGACAYCSSGNSVYFVADSPMGPWNTEYKWLSAHSCGGQPTHVGELNGRFLYMSDLWHNARAGRYYFDGGAVNEAFYFNQGRANYYWQELQFDAAGMPQQLTCGDQFSNNFVLGSQQQNLSPGLDQSSGVKGFSEACDIGTDNGNVQRLQTFRTSRSGRIGELSFTSFRGGLDGSGKPDAALQVSLVEFGSDDRPGRTLWSGSIDPSAMGYSPRRYTVRPNVSVTAGREYALVLKASLTSAGKGCYGFAFNDGNPYSMGSAFINNGVRFTAEPGRDLMFEVVMR